MVPIPGINDLEVSIQPFTPLRPGFAYLLNIVYRNMGTTTLSGSVKFQYDPALFYFTSTPIQSSSAGNEVTWNFTNLAPYETRYIKVHPIAPASLTIGASVPSSATVLPVINDSTPANNVTQSSVPVTGSYDPNDKAVSPNGPVTTAFISADSTYLEYMIRFQNTGTDTAFSVFVTDTLQSSIDIGSLKIIGASHEYKAEIADGNVIRLIFNDILLPDSNTNEPESHGYIAYRVKPLTTFAVGTNITNKAAIYFDYNDAVITNQPSNIVSSVIPVELTSLDISSADCRQITIKWSVASETNIDYYTIEKSVDGIIWEAVGTIQGSNSGSSANYYYYGNNMMKATVYYRLKQTSLNGVNTLSFIRPFNCTRGNYHISIFPNPSGNIVYISSKERFKYNLYTADGTLLRCSNQAMQHTQIDVSHFVPGNYLLRIQTETGLSVHKITVQH